MKIFAEDELSSFLDRNSLQLRAEIEGQNDDYILNVNEQKYIDYLNSKYSIDNLSFQFDQKTISNYEREIPAEHFPHVINVTRGRLYKKMVIRYHLPFSGNSQLLRLTPSTSLLWTIDIDLEDENICFGIVNFMDDPKIIEREAKEIIANIEKQSKHVITEVEKYNACIPQIVSQNFHVRKKRILQNSNLLTALGVPIKKRSEFPSTFAVPSPKITKKICVSKPVVKEIGYKPEPTLDNSTYMEILQVVHDVGRQFEKMPSTYSGKGEEELRDHFLLYLEPRFKGSATGETFNKSGKTDILLRYEGKNVFIAECKFWKGPKSYLKAISQLLGYLTWRDSKAAVVLFVESMDFTSVVKQIEAVTKEHSNYLSYVTNTDETWFNFRFHLTNDTNRELKLAVLLFHIPPSEKNDDNS